ncbi:MAG: OmpA family protein [Paraglaciecola sp.]|uniref:OmpA family protein n=1 Tax=Paraglaciecola sp. TaxID=1920173 RepID=UPI00273E05A9|nr:OmpA family protein [Paraglaciecola sp.]MDP5029261.1 OmpA family protein [Paraglaciecola sp.]MDP5129513.1 OmpA family protein [Paraglaciecola sp.]
MSNASEDKDLSDDEQQMRVLRDLLLGDHYVKQALKANAREVVSDVFSEALYDRQQRDGSVNNVILPLVEKSVEHSVANHSEQMVGALYPLVGSLVRKSVTAFITDLLEKTNSLIENSFTLKGIKWRFKARQAGVSFSQYVASQTFAFRVEQVFLIHRETGLLLNTISSGLQATADADLVSAMLTAINDFVADSFTPRSDKGEQQLDVVKTDDFTLLLTQGPSAILVAAISGNVPQKVANQMQLSLEEIHRLFGRQLTQFKGDASVFIDTEHQLRACLLAELKPQTQQAKKRPWLAWGLLIFLTLFTTYLCVKRWQAHELLAAIKEIDQQPGIVLLDAYIHDFSRVKFSILRDPNAIRIDKWLSQNQLPENLIDHSERAYASLDQAIIQQKVNNIVSDFVGIEVDWQSQTAIFSGTSTNLAKLRLQTELSKVVGLNFQPQWLEPIRLKGGESNAADDPTIIRAILDLNIAKLEHNFITFEQGQSTLSEQAIEKLLVLKDEFNNLLSLAQGQGLSLGLIIMGASDPSGSNTFNKALSQKRADAVQNKLQELGIARNRLNAIGLGVIELKTSGDGARKVLFNVVYFDAN